MSVRYHNATVITVSAALLSAAVGFCNPLKRSRSQGMENCDIALAWIDDNGRPRIHDLYSKQNGPPTEDPGESNWVLLQQNPVNITNSSTTMNPPQTNTVVRFKRNAFTGDDNDVDLRDPMVIIWAKYTADPTLDPRGRLIMSSIPKHLSANRGSTRYPILLNAPKVDLGRSPSLRSTHLSKFWTLLWIIIDAFYKIEQLNAYKPVFDESQAIMIIPPLAQTVLNTTAILASIRGMMEANNHQAYLVPNSGEHYGGSAAPCEQRITAVSGFTGSSGSIVITLDTALLWTDGRYFTQAEEQLDLTLWELMKMGEPDTPTEAEWLRENLLPGDRVAVDGAVYPKSSWDKMKAELVVTNIVLYDEQDNFVDAANEDRPECPANPLQEFPTIYAGVASTNKLVQVREKMREEGVDLLLISELDEIAWLFNARGSDMLPVFYAYALIEEEEATLLLKNVDVPETLLDSLTAANVTVFKDDINELGGYTDATLFFKTAIEAAEKVWVSKYVNAMMANLVLPAEKLVLKLSPVALLKAIKNPVEAAGMTAAHLRDSAAVVAYLSWLEQRILQSGDSIDEVSAAAKLTTVRALALQDEASLYVGPSFSPISAYGPNAAMPHYHATAESTLPILKDNVYLVDSGGHYLDGTTDITRTVHFGSPSAKQKEMFTRVLKGHIAMAQSTFPKKTTGYRLDPVARKYLWDVQLDYNHGTGHGIGHYLYIHEGPQSVSSTFSEDDTGLEANMFLSNEPGYYKENEYGFRLENVVRVVTADANGASGFLKFETISFVPIQLSLIDKEMLTPEEFTWLNDYHALCREKVGEYINDVLYFEDKQSILTWLDKATVKFSSGVKPLLSIVTVTIALIMQQVFTNYLV